MSPPCGKAAVGQHRSGPRKHGGRTGGPGTTAEESPALPQASGGPGETPTSRPRNRGRLGPGPLPAPQFMILSVTLKVLKRPAPHRLGLTTAPVDGVTQGRPCPQASCGLTGPSEGRALAWLQGTDTRDPPDLQAAAQMPLCPLWDPHVAAAGVGTRPPRAEHGKLRTGHPQSRVPSAEVDARGGTGRPQAPKLAPGSHGAAACGKGDGGGIGRRLCTSLRGRGPRTWCRDPFLPGRPEATGNSRDTRCVSPRDLVTWSLAPQSPPSLSHLPPR